MFAPLKKYKQQGSFIFTHGQILSDVSKEDPNLPGIYYIIKVTGTNRTLVYIGKSGTFNQNGQFKTQLLHKRLNNLQDGIRRQDYFTQKIKEESLDCLEIHWIVTFDDVYNDLPGYVEGQLLQEYFESHGNLPPWNKEY